ncbi:Laccase-25 [Frankliniella fusca]|uniref:Laccase-25 n=1 Tax=Frankliniella fusca TaxID=407009 RepID=A0AAE1L705_9NEOP|nr:Laccase-25 [Frankliniella fusca]
MVVNEVVLKWKCERRQCRVSKELRNTIITPFGNWAVVICGFAQYFAPTLNSADSEDHYDFKELLLFCWLNGIKATPTWWLICGSHHKEMNIFAVECYWY